MIFSFSVKNHSLVFSKMEKKASALKNNNPRQQVRSEIVIFVVFLLFSIIFIFLLNLPWSPRYYSMSIDNGIFAYGGKLITQGQIPYLDYWDNIPPAINYINALTFSLSSPTPWAVWWLNIIWLSLTTVLTCLFVRKLAGLVPSVLSGVLLILLVMDGNLFSGGDMTEFFSLIPQILALWALYNYWQFKRSRWVVVLGLVTSVAFLTKQTAIGLGVSSILVIIGINLLDHDWRKAVRAVSIYVVASLSSLVSGIILLGDQWRFADFYDQVILFNYFLYPRRILCESDSFSPPDTDYRTAIYVPCTTRDRLISAPLIGIFQKGVPSGLLENNRDQLRRPHHRI